MVGGTARKGYLALGRHGTFGLAAGCGVILGADQGCDVRIDIDHISREHAEFWVDESERLFIRDLGSTNGTRVNGQKIAPRVDTELTNGDVVDLHGGVTFWVVSAPLENYFKYASTK